LDCDLPCYRLGELALKAQHILELAIVPLGPQCFIRTRRDELQGHADAFADEQRGAFEHRVHVQLAGDFRERFRDALVRHR
jgi:hypothetical protein